jgi:hypothetical protein
MRKLNADAFEEIKYWPLEFLHFSIEQNMAVKK